MWNSCLPLSALLKCSGSPSGANHPCGFWFVFCSHKKCGFVLHCFAKYRENRSCFAEEGMRECTTVLDRMSDDRKARDVPRDEAKKMRNVSIPQSSFTDPFLFLNKFKIKMAPAPGFEPGTKWLTATYSTAELCRSMNKSFSMLLNIYLFCQKANYYLQIFNSILQKNL